MGARFANGLAGWRQVCRQGVVWVLLAGGAVAGHAAGLTIQSPAQGQNVRDNRGDFAVTVAIEDGAQLPEGFAIRVLLDGKPAAPDVPITRIPLTGVNRGTHKLQALIVDGNGNVVARSARRTFTMRQASRLNRARQ
ncbi:MAG: hypothetical protein M3Y32_13670 [Pseudomonadota bacterium]|nr:hypothetical protein [Pseudomonadota bacterium]